MKKINFAIIIFILLFSSAVHTQNKGVGVGIIAGEPTGLSFKYWLSDKTALDAALAWSFIDGGAFQIHADYIIHNFFLVSVPEGKLPFYYGIGARLKTSSESTLGVRVPLGLAYLFQNAPIDIFFEIVPILDVLPKTDFNLNAAIGGRYFFN